MRILLIHLIAMTLLLIGTSGARAVIITATSNFDFLSENYLNVSDTVTIVVRLDTELQQDLQIVAVGLQFDPTAYQYDPAASSMSSYLIYAPGSGRPLISTWLTPLPSNIDGGSVDFVGGLQSSPTLFPVAPFDQVNFGYQETALRGTRDITANTLGQRYGDVMATVVFHVIGWAHLNPISLVINSQNRVQLQDGTILDDSVVLINTPEPTTALLVGLGLVGFGAAAHGQRVRPERRRLFGSRSGGVQGPVAAPYST